MDKLITKIVALGVPGLILVVALGAASASGLAGAAVITTALASIGPGGIFGGIITLGIVCIIAHGIAEYGFDIIFKAVLNEMIENKGYTIESIKNEIRSNHKYKLMSKSLRLKIIGYLDDYEEFLKNEETMS